MKNDTVSAPVFLCVLAALGVFAVFSTGCGTTIDAGKVLTAITNAIPHGTTTTTTTQPAQTGGTVPQMPPASTNAPLPTADMTVNYDAAGTGIDVPAVASGWHWYFPSPDNVYESGKGYERVKSASWSIVGTNYPATFSGGYCLATNVHASGLINPIALLIVGEKTIWEYTIWHPSISPKEVKGVKK